jgi:hypothetical protein
LFFPGEGRLGELLYCEIFKRRLSLTSLNWNDTQTDARKKVRVTTICHRRKMEELKLFCPPFEKKKLSSSTQTFGGFKIVLTSA